MAVETDTPEGVSSARGLLGGGGAQRPGTAQEPPQVGRRQASSDLATRPCWPTRLWSAGWRMRPRVCALRKRPRPGTSTSADAVFFTVERPVRLFPFVDGERDHELGGDQQPWRDRAATATQDAGQLMDRYEAGAGRRIGTVDPRLVLGTQGSLEQLRNPPRQCCGWMVNAGSGASEEEPLDAG